MKTLNFSTFSVRGTFLPTCKLPAKCAARRKTLCDVFAARSTTAQSASRATFFGRSCATPSNRSWAKVLCMLTCAVFLLPMISGCAIEDGKAWGQVQATIDAKLQVDTGRWDATNTAYRSSNSRLVRIQSVDLHITQVGLAESNEASGDLSFDPTDPPAPYTNCHSGHCHLPDGSIMSFAEIEKALQSGASATKTSLIIAENIDLSLLSNSEAMTPHIEIPHTDIQDRAKYKGLSLEIGSVTLKLSVLENEQWVNFDLSMPLLNHVLVMAKDFAFGQDEDFKQILEAQLRLNVNFIDNVDWEKLANNNEAQASFWKKFNLSLSIVDIK